jgi:hypothetical protein
MKEPIFNLFLFVENDFILQLGAVSHDAEGSDELKLAFLRSQAATDHAKAERYPVPERYIVLDHQEQVQRIALRYTLFKKLMAAGRQYEVFDEVFEAIGAPQAPLSCITPVVDGKIRIDKVVDFDPVKTDLQKQHGLWVHYPIADYLSEYLTEDGLDLPRLLNDDSFTAIKVLYNHRHFVSAAKLLVSFIDMVAFLEFGDSPSCFQRWLDSYAQLTSVRISSAELWEFRNSLVHMTSLDSRKVLAGTVRRLMFYVGKMPEGIPTEDDEAKYFSLLDLIIETTNAMERWFDSFNANPSKFNDFVERYDRIVSDVRFAIFMAK